MKIKSVFVLAAFALFFSACEKGSQVEQQSTTGKLTPVPQSQLPQVLQEFLQSEDSTCNNYVQGILYSGEVYYWPTYQNTVVCCFPIVRLYDGAGNLVPSDSDKWKAILAEGEKAPTLVWGL
jgi:hypothetical protein